MLPSGRDSSICPFVTFCFVFVYVELRWAVLVFTVPSLALGEEKGWVVDKENGLPLDEGQGPSAIFRGSRSTSVVEGVVNLRRSVKEPCLDVTCLYSQGPFPTPSPALRPHDSV